MTTHAKRCDAYCAPGAEHIGGWSCLKQARHAYSGEKIFFPLVAIPSSAHLCDAHMNMIRRRELDAWQPDTGEHQVIRVADLGAAMSAQQWGGRAIERMTDDAPGPFLMTGPRYLGRGAAHLARQALGITD